MAGILNEFVQNTKILASQVNENFATVQSDMEELGNGLNVIINNELTKAKADLLEDIETVSNNKASKDLSDAKPSAEFKANILDYVAPNLTAGYSISIGFTAPSAGWIEYTLNSSANHTQTLYIDGKPVAQNWQLKGDGRAGSLGIQGMVFIGANSTTSGQAEKLTFYPCKGVR